jgi:hypothetical protein
MKRGDCIVIAVLLFIGTMMFFWRTTSSAQLHKVVIAQNGVELYRFTLTDDLQRTIPVELPLGQAQVKIEGGKVWLQDVGKAICPKNICKHTGKISRGGEAIICVPNRLSIVIEDKIDIDGFAR